MRALLLLWLIACRPAPDPSSESADLPRECAAPGHSGCDNTASIVRGEVRLAVDGGATEGDLVVMLHHARYGAHIPGNHYGEGVHGWVAYRDIDLAAGPVAFEIDMCNASMSTEMWSEENCEYNLIAILDQDGDNAVEAGEVPNAIPSPGEPTGHTELWLSCHGESPCVELVLDCADGGTCLPPEDDLEPCTCTTPSCAKGGLCTN